MVNERERREREREERESKTVYNRSFCLHGCSRIVDNDMSNIFDENCRLACSMMDDVGLYKYSRPHWNAVVCPRWDLRLGCILASGLVFVC